MHQAREAKRLAEQAIRENHFGVRALFLWILAVVIFLSYACVLVPILWLRPQNLIHAAARSWSRLVCKIAGVSIHVENAERAGAGPTVVISNHLSLFDMIVMYHVFPELQFRWLAKASLFKIPVWGWGMWGAGYIPVQRDDPRSASASMQAAAEHVRRGKSVIVFAEGTRGPGGGRMLPFKKGGFILAKRAGVPIQPMTILDSDQIIPKSKGIPPIRRGIVHVILHAPITPEAAAELSVEELRDQLRDLIGAPLR